MTKRLKARWIAALRSGKYTQGQGHLRQKDDSLGSKTGLSYCCLGVLCEVAKVKYNGDDGFPPDQFGRRVGLHRLIGRRGYEEAVEYQLTTMNDAEGWSFKKIAAWLERTKVI